MTNQNSTLKTGLGTELSVRNTNITSYESETADKCGYYKRFGKSNCIHILLSVSAVGNIVLVLVVTLIATKLGARMEADDEKYPLHQLPKGVAQESLCIPCDYLGSRVKAEDTLFDNTADTVELQGKLYVDYIKVGKSR
ncbi:hypothetical protein CHS0354_032331 [Potamilus streckersoni]|uniref:Uncharacterized protein n=1 Tax=Potamilus streckersoni TaxID=2493646 RepID=A0AAE0TGK0_9BIVA|nr:hypothetical protein CHS0354_032331 [Potamilus streckersoni]